MKTLKDITGDSLEQMIDFKVVDQDGDSVGTLHSLWSDPTTGAVEFLGVKTGWLFGQNHVVPAEKAELDESQNVVRLPYTSLFVKEAPSMSADAEISEAEEENICRYYGLDAGCGTQPATSGYVDKVSEAPGAFSLAASSGQDEGMSNVGASLTDTGTTTTSTSRLRRTVRSEAATPAGEGSPAFTTGTDLPAAGSAVRGALDSLMPGDSSSDSTVPATAASPASYGTTNLYGSTGSVTPVAADSAGTRFDTAAATSASGTAPGNFGVDNVSKPASTGPHPDPITGEPGAHPVGTGAGALAGGVAGVAIGGAIGGPIGAPIGAAIGAVAGAVGGGYAGKGIAESINPTDENAFWEKGYRGASYYEEGYDYTDYSPAYRTGYEGFGRYATAGREYPDVEADLEREYSSNRGSSKLDWDKAKHAARDAWDRVKGKVSGPTS